MFTSGKIGARAFVELKAKEKKAKDLAREKLCMHNIRSGSADEATVALEELRALLQRQGRWPEAYVHE